MNFTEYQELAKSTAIYPSSFAKVYPALGLCGEAGEVAEKIKKVIRDGVDYLHEEEFKAELTKELGDVLWYVAALASDLDISLDDVAEKNVEKLASRKIRNKIGGSGDNR
jgi:NTP pyrophosphatase (non-canonical NTP hydrolase)